MTNYKLANFDGSPFTSDQWQKVLDDADKFYENQQKAEDFARKQLIAGQDEIVLRV